MYVSLKHSKMLKQFIIHSLILATVLMLGPRQILASEESPDDAGAMVLVLEDCDRDNKLSTAPYGDAAFLINSECELVRKFHGLNITSAFCDFRNISVSEDSRFFAVCERMPNALVVYETATSRKMWSLIGIFNSPVFIKNLLYVTNYDSIFAIDSSGIIVKHARIAAYDMAFDSARNYLWVSGIDIKKCNLDLEPVMTVEYIKGIRGPLLIEVNPDGSIWVAQKDAYNRYSSENRLVKVSPEGKILQTINLEFSPVRVCVDKSDGSVWTTGIIKERDLSGIGDEMPEILDELNKLVRTKIETFTRKYDSEGSLIFEISEGGYSIELDPSDGSAWIAGRKNIWHFSANGRNLGSYAGSSDGQKWLAIVPGK
ncbi:MAG: NHL repeat-containing protein [Planctomycetota bacterium]|jgi:hypothetical protein